jgi:hypothetical protein
MEHGEDGSAGFRHREIGYTISMPEWGGISPWELHRVKGVDLAFRDSGASGRSTMTLLSQCRRSGATPQILARQLTIGIPQSQIERSGPVALGGDSGWSQTFVTHQEGVPVRVKTVTVVSLPCVFDWVLVVPGPLGPIEPVFDRWWASFERHAVGAEGERHSEAAR